MKKVAIIGFAVVSALVAYYFYISNSKKNPFDEIEWVEDSPGSTERYVTFTSILKSSKIPVGPTVGADYAVLRFEDLDSDGIKEAIIETERGEGQFAGGSREKVGEMVKIVWTDQAIDDLNDIAEYIAENSERYAMITVRKLYERTEILRNFPLSGRIVPEKGEETSENLLRATTESSTK